MEGRGEGGKSAQWGGSGRLWKRSAGLGAGGWKEAGSPGGEKDTRDPERVSYCLLFPGKGVDSRRFLSSGSRRSGRAGASPPLRGASASAGQRPGRNSRPRPAGRGGGSPGARPAASASVSRPRAPRCSWRWRPRAPGGRRLGMFPSVPSLPPR